MVSYRCLRLGPVCKVNWATVRCPVPQTAPRTPLQKQQEHLHTALKPHGCIAVDLVHGIPAGSLSPLSLGCWPLLGQDPVQAGCYKVRPLRRPVVPLQVFAEADENGFNTH